MGHHAEEQYQYKSSLPHLAALRQGYIETSAVLMNSDMAEGSAIMLLSQNVYMGIDVLGEMFWE